MTKPFKLKKQTAWCLVSVVSFILGLVMPFFEGRSNAVWVIPPFLPAGVLPLLFLPVSCIVLFFYWIRSLLAKRFFTAEALMFVGSLLLSVAWFAIGPAYFYQLGFRNYAKKVLTADEWRGISHFAQQHLKPGEFLLGPKKNLWTEKDHRALWSSFTVATQIQKLDPSLVVYVRPDNTAIVWGGTLAGHRGIIVFSKGNDAFLLTKTKGTMFIAPDIATFVGE